MSISCTLDDLQLQSVIAISCLYYMIPDSRSKTDLKKIITFGNVSIMQVSGIIVDCMLYHEG